MQEPLPIFRSTDAREAGVHPSTLRRRTRAGHPRQLVRLAPNAFVAAAAWSSAGPRTRHVTRAHARLMHRGPTAAASHVSAAAIHDLPWLSRWPDVVDLTVPRSSGRRASSGVRLHSRPLESHDVDDTGIVRATSLERTAIDIAVDAHRREAIVVLDAALRAGVSRDALLTGLDRLGVRGRASAAAAIEFADGAADAVSESLARVVFDELVTPPPVLQQVFRVDGHEYRVDFWFPDQGVIVEIDGRAKYEQPRYMSGRSAADVFVDEKRRHERLLSADGVRQVLRLEWRDLFDRRALVLRLRKLGIPCRAIDELSACSLLVA